MKNGRSKSYIEGIRLARSFLELREIANRTKARDDYTCQMCGIKEGLLIFPRQTIAPRYAEKNGSTFVVYHPWVQRKKGFLPAILENVREVNWYLWEGPFEKAARYPYYFQRRSTDSGTDGFELRLQVEKYLEWNPNLLEGCGYYGLSAIEARLLVDYIDGNPQNEADSNLRSLCQFCYHNVNKFKKSFARRTKFE